MPYFLLFQIGFKDTMHWTIGMIVQKEAMIQIMMMMMMKMKNQIGGTIIPMKKMENYICMSEFLFFPR